VLTRVAPPALIVTLLALVTLLVFAPAYRADFVNWDDETLLVDNSGYRGLGWAQLRWMVTTPALGHWAPLLWLSFGLDYVLYGMRPAGYHLTNVLLHAATVVLFYFVVGRLLQAATAWPPAPRRLAAAVAAVFFALHPLRAESVAWVKDRGDVLAGLLFLVAVLAYLHAAGHGGVRRRWLLAGSLVAYGLALAAKATVMPLPVVLVLLDVYPLRRICSLWGGAAARRVWLEKVPYLALTLAAGIAEYRTVEAGSQFTVLDPSSLAVMVAYNVWFYVYKTILPLDLSPLYELPAWIDPREPRFLVAGLGALGLTVAAWLLRRAWPAGLVAYAYYVVMLAPMSGIVHAGVQLTADRYSYLACLGWAVLVGSGVGWLAQQRARPVVVALGALGTLVVVTGLGGLTWRQVGVWRDSGTLWRHAIAVTPDCSLCYGQLATWHLKRGDATAALAAFEHALTLRPDRMRMRAGAGQALVALGRVPEAIPQYRLFLAQNPGAFTVRLALAEALLGIGRPREAVIELGRAMQYHGPGEVVAYYRRAVATRPDASLPRAGLIQAYGALGLAELAREHLGVLQDLDPGLARAVEELFAPGPTAARGVRRA
jgi:protein O-mannosyl-transferase